MKRKTRPPVAQDTLYSHIHTAILHGSLHAGDRLLSRLSYEKEFGLSTITVQRAFERLVQDGFVEVRGPQGTYVSQRLPHLFRFALAFSTPLARTRQNPWHTALLESADRIAQASGYAIGQYGDINDRVKSTDLNQLIADVAGHRVAGVIFVGYPQLNEQMLHQLCQTVPCIVIAGERSFPPFPRLTLLELGGPTGFLKRALDYLIAHKRRRVAFLGVSGTEKERLDYFHERIRRSKLATSPGWVHGIDPLTPHWAANMMHLLFGKSQSNRPDALIVSDDNLVDYTCRGLVEAGVRVPHDVEVVAHCNYPVHSTGVLPLARLGYDSHAVISSCIELIQKQQRNEHTMDLVKINAVFEWELTS